MHKSTSSTCYTHSLVHLFSLAFRSRRIAEAASVCGFSACVFTFSSYHRSVDVERYRTSADGTFCLVGFVRSVCRNGSTYVVHFKSLVFHRRYCTYVKNLPNRCWHISQLFSIPFGFEFLRFWMRMVTFQLQLKKSCFFGENNKLRTIVY